MQVRYENSAEVDESRESKFKPSMSYLQQGPVRPLHEIYQVQEEIEYHHEAAGGDYQNVQPQKHKEKVEKLEIF